MQLSVFGHSPTGVSLKSFFAGRYKKSTRRRRHRAMEDMTTGHNGARVSIYTRPERDGLQEPNISSQRSAPS